MTQCKCDWSENEGIKIDRTCDVHGSEVGSPGEPMIVQSKEGQVVQQFG